MVEETTRQGGGDRVARLLASLALLISLINLTVTLTSQHIQSQPEEQQRHRVRRATDGMPNMLPVDLRPSGENDVAGSLNFNTMMKKGDNTMMSGDDFKKWIWMSSYSRIPVFYLSMIDELFCIFSFVRYRYLSNFAMKRHDTAASEIDRIKQQMAIQAPQPRCAVRQGHRVQKVIQDGLVIRVQSVS